MDKLQYKIYHENKTHTPDDFPYNTYLCSIPLDFKSVNLHWHDEVEIIVIKKGTGIVSVDLTTYSVSAGDIIFVLPGQLHAISQKDREIMEYENILFKSSHLSKRFLQGRQFCGADAVPLSLQSLLHQQGFRVFRYQAM